MGEEHRKSAFSGEKGRNMGRRGIRKLMMHLIAAVCLFELAMAAGAEEWLADSNGLASDAIFKAPSVQALARKPLHFEANQGQFNPQARFISRGQGYTLFLTNIESIVTLNGRRVKAGGLPKQEVPVVRMSWKGADPKARLAGLEEMEGKTNYLIGNDPSVWRTDVPSYAKVRCENVYPGVDLVFYGNQQQLEYDFVVAPGADPNVIRLAFAGQERLSIDRLGNLVIHAGTEKMLQKAPVIYQEINGTRLLIAGSYIRKGKREVGFKLASYDTGKTLFIDPVLSFSSFLGGNGMDEAAAGIAADGSGNTYVTGYTKSTNFPGTSGRSGSDFDAFVTKVNSAGSIVYSTFIGGTADDRAYGIVVDGSGTVFITGETSSGNAFPNVGGLTNGDSGPDAFLCRLNAAGSTLLYSTKLVGGSSDLGFAVAADNSGNAYVAGMTVSGAPFPLWPNSSNASSLIGPGGSYDAFIAKINTNATGSAALKYVTRFGGASWDYAYGVALDSGGNTYVTGYTTSGNFPIAGSPYQPGCGTDGACNGYRDVFVTKVDPTGGHLVFSTFLGGSEDDYGYAIALDKTNNAYVTGKTTSKDFPGTSGHFQSGHAGMFDVFVAKLNSSGSALAYATYLGGNSDDAGQAIAVDSGGNAYVTGSTYSRIIPFPTRNPIQAALNGTNSDAFVATLNPAGTALLFSTYLGGSGNISGGDKGYAIAVDPKGNIHVAGQTDSSDFPVTAGAFQPTHGTGGYFDSFVTRISPIVSPTRTDLLGSWTSGVYSRNTSTGEWTYLTTSASQIAAGDLDADGIDDVVGVWPSSGIWVKYSSTGNWEYLTSAPSWIAVGDTNGDHKAEILGLWDSAIWSRDGESGAWNNLTSGASQIALGDMDGDGKADLVGVWSTGVWAKYSSTGQWKYLTSSPTAPIACGDLNGDGKSDLLGIWNGAVYVMDSATEQWTKLTEGASQVTAGDLDGDGKDDLIGIWSTTGVWIKYSSTGSWASLATSVPVWIATARVQ
jgi:hypothetical protein